MALKTFRPTSPGLRQLVLVDKSHLWKGGPVKMLVEGKSKTGGRNNHGRITTRHIGGGHKVSYRLVDFKRRKFDVEGTVERLEYDPNRTAFIALVGYTDGHKAYILAPEGLQAGDIVGSGPDAEPRVGNCLPLGRIPLGLFIHTLNSSRVAAARFAAAPVAAPRSTSALRTPQDMKWPWPLRKRSAASDRA